MCQANKVNTRLLKPSLIPITPEHTLPFQTITMDFITKLPISEGYNTILTITDHNCSKAAIFIPCKETITAEGVTDLYLKYVYPQFGIPKKVISDRDTRFVSKFAKGLCQALEIYQNISVMISHRGYDTDAYFSFLLTFPTCPPHSPTHPLDCSYSSPVTHTRPLRLFSDYFLLSYLWALRLRFLVLTQS
jgi:hypothetical protein